jgi:hypothetical protein
MVLSLLSTVAIVAAFAVTTSILPRVGALVAPRLTTSTGANPRCCISRCCCCCCPMMIECGRLTADSFWKRKSSWYSHTTTTTTRTTNFITMMNHHPDQDHYEQEEEEKEEEYDRTPNQTTTKATTTTSTPSIFHILTSKLSLHPTQSVLFSIAMIVSGAILGPCLDSYHSLFHVLQYDQPLIFFGSSSSGSPLEIVTTYWVPPLFGLAAWIIGWMYLLLDEYFDDNYSDHDHHALSTTPTLTDEMSDRRRHWGHDVADRSPSPPKILYGISFFTFQYWLSGILYASGVVDRTTLLAILILMATFGFRTFDRTISGFVTSLATAIGGPLIEVGLLSLSRYDHASLLHGMGYHYTDLGETGFFPLWIVPVYFLGGPANGNLARGYWTFLTSLRVDAPSSSFVATDTASSWPCTTCNATRCTDCPNW